VKVIANIVVAVIELEAVLRTRERLFHCGPGDATR